MKKIVINLCLIVTALLIYFIQINFFNWFTIAGVMPNLFILFALFLGLFCKKQTALIYSAIIGMVLDIVIGQKVGIMMIDLCIITAIAIIFEKNFSKDSRVTIMLMVIAMTAIYEIILCVVNYTIFASNIEISSFIKILLIEILYNVILTIIIYPLIQKAGAYIENEYKGNKILTRYF